MSDVFNSIGEGVANLVGAGPQGGPLGGFKPVGKILAPIAAAATGAGLADFAGIGGAIGETGLTGAELGGAAGGALAGGENGPIGAVLGGAGGGLLGGTSAFGPGGALNFGGGAAGGAAGAAAPLAAAGGPATAPGDLGAAAATSAGDLTVPQGALPGSFVSQGAATSETIPGVTNPSNFLQSAGLEAPTQGFNPVEAGGPGAGALSTPMGVDPATQASYNQTATGLGLPGSAGVGSGGSSASPGFFKSIGNFAANPSLSTAGGVASSIPAGAYIGAAGLGYEALKGTPPIPNLSTLNNIAGQAESNSSTLINAELSGKLPPGASAGVQQGLEAAQAQIRSQFAGMGLSGSSAEADALANASQAASAQSFQIASTMAQQGISIAGLPASIYEAITQQVLGQDTQFQNAIVNFATAAGGGGGVRLQVGGSST